MVDYELRVVYVHIGFGVGFKKLTSATNVYT